MSSGGYFKAGATPVHTHNTVLGKFDGGNLGRSLVTAFCKLQDVTACLQASTTFDNTICVHT